MCRHRRDRQRRRSQTRVGKSEAEGSGGVREGRRPGRGRSGARLAGPGMVRVGKRRVPGPRWGGTGAEAGGRVPSALRGRVFQPFIRKRFWLMFVVVTRVIPDD